MPVKVVIPDNLCGLKCCAVKINADWVSHGGLFTCSLNVPLTTVKKYNTEGTKPEKFHVKYLQQEECDYGKLLEWSRMPNTLSASALIIIFLSMWYGEFINISAPRCRPS